MKNKRVAYISIFAIIILCIGYFLVIQPRIQIAKMERTVQQEFSPYVTAYLRDAEIKKVHADIDYTNKSIGLVSAAYTISIESSSFSSLDADEQFTVAESIFDKFETLTEPGYLTNISAAYYKLGRITCFAEGGQTEIVIISNGKSYYFDDEVIHGYRAPRNNGQNSSNKSDESSSDDVWFAIAAAQDLVKEQLVSPSSARFPSERNAYSISHSGNSWTVSGYVDANNSLGVSIRQNWTATFTMGDSDGSQYKVSNYSVTFR